MLGFKDLQMLWKLWSLYEEIQTMDTKTLVKLLVSAVMGAVAAGGAAYLAGAPLAAVLSAAGGGALTSVMNHLRESPLASPPK